MRGRKTGAWYRWLLQAINVIDRSHLHNVFDCRSCERRKTLRASQGRRVWHEGNGRPRLFDVASGKHAFEACDTRQMPRWPASCTTNEERPRKLGMPASAARYGGRGAQEQQRISQKKRCDRMGRKFAAKVGPAAVIRTGCHCGVRADGRAILLRAQLEMTKNPACPDQAPHRKATSIAKPHLAS
jgi:hypothetical protein